MNVRLWNWRLWTGFVLSLIALLAYVFGFQLTRSIFWLSLVLFAVAGWLLVDGIRRVRSEPELYRGKRAGWVLLAVSLIVVGLFGEMAHLVRKLVPVARNAPQVGDKAPEFTLLDANGGSVPLRQLLASGASSSGTRVPSVARTPRGLLIVFYRGYW